jgi:regulator of sigma E protease
MSAFLGSAWWFVVTLGVLVTFHEFGHFWVARRCGVRVLTFSIGFGRALWSRIGKDGIQYQVAAIPLGGYVKFLDGREVDLMPGEHAVAFDRQAVWKRILIVLAGPAANLVLCVALLWVALQVGVPESTPVVGTPSGLAAEAGFAVGDRVIAVDGKDAQTWDQAIVPLALAAIDRRPLVVSVRDAGGNRRDRTLDLSQLPADFDQTDPLKAIGLHPLEGQDHPVVGEVVAGKASEGKLQAGDRLLAVNGSPVATFSEFRAHVLKEAGPGKALRIDVLRAGQKLSFAIEARREQVEGGSAWQLGVSVVPAATLVRYGPLPAFGESLRRTRKMAGETFALIGRLVTGHASTRNVSGVIGIAQAANTQASIGAGRLLAFMAALSLALCIMNLLPIPVLDGGHLLYYLIELVAGRPLSDRMLVAGQYVGLALLAGLITLAFYNDVTRLVSRLVS